jgi:hypothetical protein
MATLSASPARVAAVEQTAFNANDQIHTSILNQSALRGYLGVDLDLKVQNGDRLNVTGTAIVSGAVVINVYNPSYALPGTNVLTFLQALQDPTQMHLA